MAQSRKKFQEIFDYISINKWALPLISSNSLIHTVINMDTFKISLYKLENILIRITRPQIKELLVDFLLLTDQQDSLHKVLFASTNTDYHLYNYLNLITTKNNISMFYTDHFTFDENKSTEYIYNLVISDTKEKNIYVVETDNSIITYYDKLSFWYCNGYLTKQVVKKFSSKLLFNKKTHKMSFYVNDKISFHKSPDIFHNLEFRDKVLNFLEINNKRLCDYVVDWIGEHTMTPNYNKIINNPFFLDTQIPLYLLGQNGLKKSLEQRQLRKAQRLYNKTKNTKLVIYKFYDTTSKKLINILKSNSKAFEYYLIFKNKELTKDFIKNSDINFLIKIFYEKCQHFYIINQILDSFDLEFYNLNNTNLAKNICDFLNISIKDLFNLSYERLGTLRDCIRMTLNQSSQIRNTLYNNVVWRNYNKNNLNVLHEVLVREVNLLKPANKKEIKPLIEITKQHSNLYKTDGIFELKVIDTANELSAIGREMHICVGSYYYSALSNDITICAVYQYGYPIYCIELSKQNELYQGKLNSNNRISNGNIQLALFLNSWIAENNLTVSQQNHDYLFLNYIEPVEENKVLEHINFEIRVEDHVQPRLLQYN